MSSPAPLEVAAAPVDPARAEAFQERLLTALNESAMILMISLGHRTGLFAAMSAMAPARSDTIARRAGLNERYVREWLGAMVAARVVEIDAAAGTYRLPPEHAGVLTPGNDFNFAVSAQNIPLLAAVEDDIVHCFRHGGGVPYERYTRFHEIMAEESAQSIVAALDDHILPLVDGLDALLERGVEVLDVGCGRGLALAHLARRFPRSRFTGYDLSSEAVAWARERCRHEGLDNVAFEVRDVSDLDRSADEGRFHLVCTFDAVHDQARPSAVLKGIRRSLADDGVYLAQDIKGSSHHHGDIEHPFGTLLYATSCMHCMSVSLAAGGEGLGTMWGRETAERYFREAGFDSVAVHELEHDPLNYFYVCRP